MAGQIFHLPMGRRISTARESADENPNMDASPGETDGAPPSAYWGAPNPEPLVKGVHRRPLLAKELHWRSPGPQPKKGCGGIVTPTIGLQWSLLRKVPALWATLRSLGGVVKRAWLVVDPGLYNCGCLYGKALRLLHACLRVSAQKVRLGHMGWASGGGGRLSKTGRRRGTGRSVVHDCRPPGCWWGRPQRGIRLRESSAPAACGLSSRLS